MYRSLKFNRSVAVLRCTNVTIVSLFGTIPVICYQDCQSYTTGRWRSFVNGGSESYSCSSRGERSPGSAVCGRRGVFLSADFTLLKVNGLTNKFRATVTLSEMRSVKLTVLPLNRLEVPAQNPHKNRWHYRCWKEKLTIANYKE